MNKFVALKKIEAALKSMLSSKDCGI